MISRKQLTSTSKFFLFFTCILCLWTSNPVYSQLIPGQQSQETTEETEEYPEDPFGRRTPRGTVNGYIRAMAERDYDRASQYLNLHDTQGEGEGERLAQVLQRLLDRGGNILPYSWISDDPEGRTDDNLPQGIDRVGSVSLNDEIIQLYVEEISEADEPPLWLFSNETIEEIAGVDVDDILLVERLIPDFLQGIIWGGVSAGQWILMILLAILAYVISFIIIRLIRIFFRLVWKKTRTEPTAGIIAAFALPIRLYLAVWLFVVFTQEIGISILLRQRLSEVTVIIGAIALLLLLWRLSDFITQFSEKRMTLRGQLSGVSIVLFLRRLAKVVIIIIGFIAILSAFGVNVTAGLAALGIGGLALALGAQKSIENFVGSVTLIADRPLRVGDFCKIGETIGTVEAIGMRSTSVRTLDRTVVTIPNGELSSTRIENYAHREKFRLFTTFQMRYETTADQMRYLLVELRKVLYAHQKVDPEPARVRFAEYGAASLNVEIFAYLLAKDFNDFVEIREDVLLRMMDVVEKSGSGFAFPSQTIYLARDKGLSQEKTTQAEETVRKWRENEEMSIPKFSPDQLENLKDSLTYPPEGSVKIPDQDK